MARTLTTTAKNLISRQNIGTAFVECIKISSPELDAPLMFTNNTVNVSYNPTDPVHVSLIGTYEAIPFNIVTPPTIENEPPLATIQIDNVAREILTDVRNFVFPPKLDYFLVVDGTLVTSPDVKVSIISNPEIRLSELILRNFKVDQFTIDMQFGYEDTLSARFPNEGFTPNNFPGLF